MKKKILCFISTFIFLICLSFTSIYAIEDNQVVRLVIDFNNNGELPNSFRKTSDKINPTNNIPSLKGLKELNASGSSEFTFNSIDIIKNSIGKKFTVVDLRQESHGFLNGSAISWMGLRDNLNKGLSPKEVVAAEKKLLSSITINEPVTPYNSPGPIIANEVYDEKHLVENKGLDYIRIPVTDGERPTDEAVDFFISFVNSLSKDSWLHFHCKEGIGRTTTFLAMYDMIRNSKDVSFEDIIFRQFLLGSENLILERGPEESKRTEFLKNFYSYTKENKDNYKTSWSQWIKSKNITPYMGCKCTD